MGVPKRGLRSNLIQDDNTQPPKASNHAVIVNRSAPLKLGDPPVLDWRNLVRMTSIGSLQQLKKPLAVPGRLKPSSHQRCVAVELTTWCGQRHPFVRGERHIRPKAVEELAR